MSLEDATQSAVQLDAAPPDVANDLTLTPPTDYGPPATPDAQRAALRDLVSLSTECAATEAKIERFRIKSTAGAAKELEKATEAIRQRYKGLEETVKAQYREKIAAVQAKYNSDTQAVQAQETASRQKIEAQAEPITQKIKDRLDHDCWLAESVFDVAQNQIREEGKKAAEEHEARQKELDELVAKGDEMLTEYRVTVAAASGASAAEAATTDAPATADFAAARERVEQRLEKLRTLFLPRLLSGVFMYVVAVGLALGAAAAAYFIAGGPAANPVIPAAAAAGGTLVVVLVAGFALRGAAKKQAIAAYRPFKESVAAARKAAKAELRASEAAREVQFEKAQRRRDAEVNAAKERIAPILANANAKREAVEQQVRARRQTSLARIQSEHNKGLADAEKWQKSALTELSDQQQKQLDAAQQKFDLLTRESRRKYEQARSNLERRLANGLRGIGGIPSETNGHLNGDAPSTEGLAKTGHPNTPIEWSDSAWGTWKPPTKFATLIRFGEIQVDLRQIASNSANPVVEEAPEPEEQSDVDWLDNPLRAAQQAASRVPVKAAEPAPTLTIKLPEAFSVPASLAFPGAASLLIQTDREGRQEALGALQMVMARLITGQPAGRVRFILIDPVGLGQTFAGFMHLADYDDALVGVRVWTETDQIDQRLSDLTEHMETVIQKYLRNEYATIDEYNAQAGELAEPYRYLVISDFPTGFSSDALRRLQSIINSGARCGVFTLILRDTREPLPSEIRQEDLEAGAVNLVLQSTPLGKRFVWQDEVFRQFPLALDPPPTEDQLTKLTHVVGVGAKNAKRVEVAFDTIAPKDEQYWTMNSGSELMVAVGRSGATRLQYMRLGKGVAQHMIIAGKTGSGKSTLLHAIITNLAMWYSPDEVEFYLIDFKKGVEFKTYAEHHLPHAKAIAVESDREFGLSVLQRLDVELARRGEVYRRAGTQDLASYRQSPNAGPMPRTLLIIDEFQEFFTEEDKLASEAALLLDRLVRQGRAFGMHVILGSQTIGGNSGLGRSTLGQMAVRVALMTSDADSQIILGDGNSAARLLTRPGEGIYNDQGGLVEANSPFQVAWLSDSGRDNYLKKVSGRGTDHAAAPPPNRRRPDRRF